MEVRSVDPARLAPSAPTLPWWLAAGGGAALAAAAGWVIVAAATVVGQVGAEGRVGSASFGLATQLWLLAHGGPALIDGVRVTLAPLSLTALVAIGLHGVAGYAARQAQLGRPNQVLSAPERRRLCLSSAAVLGAMYAVVVGAVVVLSGLAIESGLRAVAVAFGLAGLIGLVGASQAVGWRPQLTWPAWARAIPRAVLTAVLVLSLGGVVATVVSLVAHRQMVAGLTAQLAPDGTGAILLSLLQGAYLVNVVVWAAAWTLGAGFSLGDQSFVSLMGNQVEVLPSFPLIGAIPQASPAPWTNLIWLVWGVLAGAAAAVIVLRSRRRARFDETALVGGLSGVLAGFAFWLLSTLARGDLGSIRLTGLGPRLPELAVMAPTLLGLAGLAAGLVLGLLRPPVGLAAGLTVAPSQGAAPDQAAAPEPISDPGTTTAPDSPIASDPVPDPDPTTAIGQGAALDRAAGPDPIAAPEPIPVPDLSSGSDPTAAPGQGVAAGQAAAPEPIASPDPAIAPNSTAAPIPAAQPGPTVTEPGPTSAPDPTPALDPVSEPSPTSRSDHGSAASPDSPTPAGLASGLVEGDQVALAGSAYRIPADQSDSGVRRVGDGTRLFRLRRAGRAAETVDSGSSPAELAETQALPPEALPTEPLPAAQRPAQPGRPVIQPRLIGWPGPAAPSPSSGRRSEPDVPPDQLPLDFTDPNDLI
ncbi:MAG: DUF6350 family protein [Propionibacteriaceae bacterium]|nr:DUF6350 family protein [Propionibacteriaceae bacterium]